MIKNILFITLIIIAPFVNCVVMTTTAYDSNMSISRVLGQIEGRRITLRWARGGLDNDEIQNMNNTEDWYDSTLMILLRNK